MHDGWDDMQNTLSGSPDKDTEETESGHSRQGEPLPASPSR